MVEEPKPDRFAAREPALGYLYQARRALFELLRLPESTELLIEKDDDLDFVDESGRRSLSSLKHKAAGERLTGLATDFWKSIRIWLDRYRRYGRVSSNLRFDLLTTNTLEQGAALSIFLPDSGKSPRLSTVKSLLAGSTSELSKDLSKEFDALSDAEQEDFVARITIYPDGIRIIDVPAEIQNQHMRTIRREHRPYVYERLEGWWFDLVIDVLAGKRVTAISGSELSDKLHSIAEEYKADSLPITFRGKSPPDGIDPEGDARLFVEQLRSIGAAKDRVRNAILDYYRAFAQRSAWARENLLISNEIEEYEERLIEEWAHYKAVVCERLGDDSDEVDFVAAGSEIYRWAEMQSGHIRIRERVTEPYVIRGGFHILANSGPEPRVFWHPHFLERLRRLLGAAA